MLSDKKKEKRKLVLKRAEHLYLDYKKRSLNIKWSEILNLALRDINISYKELEQIDLDLSSKKTI